MEVNNTILLGDEFHPISYKLGKGSKEREEISHMYRSRMELYEPNLASQKGRQKVGCTRTSNGAISQVRKTDRKYRVKGVGVNHIFLILVSMYFDSSFSIRVQSYLFPFHSIAPSISISCLV